MGGHIKGPNRVKKERQCWGQNKIKFGLLSRCAQKLLSNLPFATKGPIVAPKSIPSKGRVKKSGGKCVLTLVPDTRQWWKTPLKNQNYS